MKPLVLLPLLVLAAGMQVTVLPRLTGGEPHLDPVLILVAGIARFSGAAGGFGGGLLGGLLLGAAGGVALPLAFGYAVTGAVAGWLLEDGSLARLPGLLISGPAIPALLAALEAVTLVGLGLAWPRPPLDALQHILWNTLLLVPLLAAAPPRSAADEDLRRMRP